jgi:hypothetical protein
VVSDLGDQPRFPVPEDATVITADKKLMPQLIPVPKVSQRIAFSVDDMHNTPRQIPAFNLAHRWFELIEMMIVQVRSLFRGAVHRIRGLDMHLHRGQGSAVMSVHQQRSRQVITNIMLMSQLAQVPLVGVVAVVNLAPIVYQ